MTQTDAPLRGSPLNLALTKGPLSYVESPKSFNRRTNGKDLSHLIRHLVPAWEVVKIQLTPLELFLKTKTGENLEITKIRAILTELQQWTQQSFVALYNPARQYVLISVRG